MKKLKNIVISLVIAVLAAFYFWPNKTCDSSIVVYAIYDQSKLGEVNMVMSVSEAVPQICKNHAFLTYTADFKLLSKNLDKNKKNLIVTAGQYGIDFLKTVTPLKGVKFLLCVHQWFDSMQDLHDISIAIPKHALNESIKTWAQKQNIQLITTRGVLHRMSSKAINAEDISMIKLQDAMVGIVIGGDAEMPNGKDWRLFSEKNACEFGLQVCEF